MAYFDAYRVEDRYCVHCGQYANSPVCKECREVSSVEPGVQDPYTGNPYNRSALYGTRLTGRITER